MGRQISYYMELDSFKLLVNKAFELGFKVIEGQNNFKICECIEQLVFSQQQIYFYLEEAGKLIVGDNGYIDTLASQLIESGFSNINERKKEISSARLWVSTGFWSNKDEFIYRNEILDKKYSALTRYVKRLAPCTEVGVKAQNPIYEGKKFTYKVYITPFLLKKVQSAEYDCV